jgi:hypothetical protein
MVLAFIILLIMENQKGNLGMIKGMVKVVVIIIMEINMKANSKII